MASTEDAVIAAARQYGVKVYENRNIPADEWIIFGRGDEPEMPLPSEWAVMSPEQRKHHRAMWVLAHGGILFVHDRRVVCDG